MAAKKKAASTATGRGTTKETDAKTLKKIQGLASDIYRVVNKGSNPTIEIRVRALSNVSFNEKHHLIELGERRSRASSSTRRWRASSCRR
jgi:DNA topoisomerase VI subunit A